MQVKQCLLYIQLTAEEQLVRTHRISSKRKKEHIALPDIFCVEDWQLAF
jgi:hypothetical protein